jgi:amino acid transporter
MNSQSILADNELKEFGYEPKLSRSLTTWQLTAFGLTYLQPIGPAVIFGFLLATSGGSVALPYMLAFVGMIFTILSYSVLIKEYPLSGSIYNYVKYVISPFWGFIAGWLLALDYILIPTITSVSSAIYAHQLVPAVSYEVWLLFFVSSMGALNLIGIKSTSYINSAILFIQIAIVMAGFVIWANFLMKSGHGLNSLISVTPFHFESYSGLLQASSLAIFSFLGFDAVTTMAEESVHPRRDIPRAMMICTCIGFSIMFLSGYLGVLLFPSWRELIADQGWLNTTLFNAAKLTGGDLFGLIYTFGFILAMMITNLVSTAAASRLLYGIGRDGFIPSKLFSAVNQRFKTPHWNIIFIVLIELVLGSYANPDQLAELINYGAISGFIMLNFCGIWLGIKRISNLYGNSQNFVRAIPKYFIFPAFGLVVMFSIFLNMKNITLVFGSLWGVIGILYYYIRLAMKSNGK